MIRKDQTASGKGAGRGMIISKTPMRISFFGGGTDFPGFFNEFGGSVIATSFDKYSYVIVRHLPPFFTYETELVYAETERVNSLDEIRHPLIREAMRYLDMRELRVSYEADLPARTGLGTSSAFAVGLLQCFYALKGKYADKEKLALDAIRLEREVLRESGGWQDQVAVSYGGLNRIDFSSDGFCVSPVIIPKDRKDELCSNLMLFYTGISRYSAQVQKHHETAIRRKTADLREMLSLVGDAEKVLTGRGDLADFGRLLDHEWRLKRSVNRLVTNETIDEYYERAIKAGALGGKLLGAGAGGFLLLFAGPDRREEVRGVLGNLMEVPFAFEEEGSRILYYVPEYWNGDSSGQVGAEEPAVTVRA